MGMHTHIPKNESLKHPMKNKIRPQPLNPVTNPLPVLGPSQEIATQLPGYFALQTT